MDKPEETAFDYMLSKLSGKKKKKSKSGKKSGSPQTEVQIGQFSKRESDSSSVSLSSRYTMPGIQQDKHYDVSYPLRPKKSNRSDNTRGVAAGSIPDTYSPESIIGNIPLPLNSHSYLSQEYDEPVQPFLPNRGQSSVMHGNGSRSRNTSETNPRYSRVPFEDCYRSNYSGVLTQNPERSSYASSYDSRYSDTVFRDRSRILYSANDLSPSSQFYSQSPPSDSTPYDYGKHYGSSKGVFTQPLHSRQKDLHNPDRYY